VREAVVAGITCTIFDDEAAQALANAAAATGLTASVHVKVDTGMARLGLPPGEVAAFLGRLRELPGLRVEGMFTHFATADEEDASFLTVQWSTFNQLVAELERLDLRPEIVHAANSAAALRYPQTRYDLVRVGIALYGLDSSPEAPAPADLRPVMSFHTEIAQVREVPAGTPISYGGTFVTERPSRIATIPVGYADGFRRAPQTWREVLVGGRRAPVVGRVCMDYTMIDVTDVPNVRRGDAVVLIGRQGHDEISAEEVALWLGTSNYEVVAAILPRVPRESLEEG
jgi:alanine racemase